ncbi:MAG: hypothetical protein FJY46_12630 [Betaproteobacteria bacterium]|nr:hypothetical protein [Betaproteobacteria bacterium]
MDYTIKESNQTIYTDKLGLSTFGTVYSEGSSNTIFLGDSISAAPSFGINYIYGIDKYNLLSYFRSPAGIVVDALKGVVRNGWGGTDYFQKISGFQGSGFTDFFQGSLKDEIFYTGGGADTVIGGGGWDKVTFYSQPSTDFAIELSEATATFTLTELKYPQNIKILKDIDQIEFGDKSVFAPVKGYAVNARILGVWQPIDAMYYTPGYTPVLANSFWGNLKFGPAAKEGMAAIGWAYSGFDNKATTVTPVNSLLIEQTASGELLIANDTYLSSSTTNGGGSVIVADFNRDGQSDIFLAAHNESPLVASASTAYLSDEFGKFKVVRLPDLVMAHDAQLYNSTDGKPSVIVQSFGLTNNRYTFDGREFQVISQPISKSVGSMSIAIADLDGLPGLEALSGDVKLKGGAYGDDKFYIGVYRYGGGDFLDTLPLKVLTPYMTSRPQFQSLASEWGIGVTHTYRIWIDDFNHDGKPDVLAGTSMWKQEASGSYVYPTMLQMFQNKGELNFSDVTDILNKEFPWNSAEIDYNLQIRDIDHSGINSYLSSGPTYEGHSRQQNFILLNDGTGRLYEYKRSEFLDYLKDIQNFARSKGYNPDFGEFHAYTDVDGKISFVVELSLKWDAVQFDRRLIVQLPLSLEPSVDFKQDIKLDDRNGSYLIRTWAGNDVIGDVNAASQLISKLDGGLGIDIAKYGRAATDYALIPNGGGEFTLKKDALTKLDQLTNIERLQFADKTIRIDTKAHGSYADLPDTLYQFFVVGFGAAPGVTYMDQMAEAYRYWLPQYKDGTVKQIVEAFTTKSQFTAVYPQALYRTEGGKYYAYAHDASLAGNPLMRGAEVSKAVFDTQMASLAQGLVATIVKTSASESTKTAAAADIQAALGLGGDWTIGKVIYTVFGNLASKPLSDPTWGGTAKQFANQVAVAKYYTDTLSQSTDDVTTLRSVMAAVTNTTDVSSTDAIASLIGVALLNGPGG